MIKEGWKQIGIREKMQIINGTTLVFAAITLYFLAFIMTLTIGYPIVTAGTTMLGTALAFFGITAFVKNQMIKFETSIDEKIKKIEEKEKHNNKEIEKQS